VSRQQSDPRKINHERRQTDDGSGLASDHQPVEVRASGKKVYIDIVNPNRHGEHVFEPVHRYAPHCFGQYQNESSNGPQDNGCGNNQVSGRTVSHLQFRRISPNADILISADGERM
jgi:hypothetical protein